MGGVGAVAELEADEITVGHGEAEVDETLQIKTIVEVGIGDAGIKLSAPKIIFGKLS